jgi:hypothetical protein
MTLHELLAETTRRGIRLEATDVTLRYEAPKGTMTPALRTALVRHKPDLLTVLWRLEAMRRFAHEAPRPLPCAREDARGGPGWCFSCGDPLDHADACGRCSPCDIAADVFYATRPQGDAFEVVQ